jgi:hypothetical protein
MAAASQTAPRETPGRSPFNAGEKQNETTRAQKIIEEIKKIRDSYGQRSARDSQAIPFRRVATFLEEVEALAKGYRENDASERVEKAAERIEVAAAKLNNGMQNNARPIIYAQAVRRGGIGGEPAIKETSAEPPREDPREYKKVMVRIRDQKAAEEVKNIPTEALMAKVHGDVGASQARKGILAVYRLKSGDVILYAKDNAGKKNLEENGE